MENPFTGRRAYRLLEPDFANISYDRMLKSDTLRHRIRLHPRATHGYYLVDDIKDQSSSQLFKFCHGDDPYAALEHVRLDRIDISPPAPATAPRATAVRDTAQHAQDSRARLGPESQGTRSNTPLGNLRMSSCSTELVGSQTLPPQVHVISAPEPLPKATLQGSIDQVERNALMPLYTVGPKPDDILNTFYAIRMRVDERHREFVPYARKDYKLIVDTGENMTWLYARGFSLMTDVVLGENEDTFRLLMVVRGLVEHEAS
ncbi:hypothetical protein C8T65DRAFT_34742 [Cerioporus squamosus]|nr:hypothetical protein C8T65DRAFT_34742 [Cerioporus squamosus]